jgi:hypothetical protein
MPDLRRACAAEMRLRHGCRQRGVLVYRLDSELMVSRQAMQYRPKLLEVGDE